MLGDKKGMEGVFSDSFDLGNSRLEFIDRSLGGVDGSAEPLEVPVWQ